MRFKMTRWHQDQKPADLASRDTFKLVANRPDVVPMLDSLSSDLGGKHRAEPVPPISDGFVANIDPALMKEIFNIPQ